MTQPVNPLATLVMTPTATYQPTAGKTGGGTWFEAMAKAWGQALDKQADTIEQQSNALSGGNDTPAAITELTAQSLKMGFLSSSSHSAISAVGDALNTMARKS